MGKFSDIEFGKFQTQGYTNYKQDFEIRGCSVGLFVYVVIVVFGQCCNQIDFSKEISCTSFAMRTRVLELLVGKM